MMNVFKSLFVLLILVSIGCNNDDPAKVNRIADFDIDEFDYFDEIPNVSTGLWRFNKDDKQASLGRVLFYDKLLSLNNSTSCATCHQQSAAFAENKALSEGLFGDLSKRNSTALMNGAFRGKYFWDGRRDVLSLAVLDPIKDHSEMDFDDIDALISRLEGTSYYSRFFVDAFGTNEITEERIGVALSEFVASLYTYDSKWDEGIDNDFTNFTASENAGREIFEQHNCSSCHFGRNLDSYYSTANIGLDVEYADLGIGDGNFRVPTLRNIELTAPYMHDGRYNTLEEVIDFYDHGVQLSEHLSESLRDENGQPKRMNLSEDDKQNLLSFLLTMTDASLVYDERFSNPF